MTTVAPVEWIWLLSSGGGLLFTLVAFVDAWRLRNVLNGARRLVARGNVRREVLRVIVQTLLLVVIIPGLFIDRPVTLSLPILCLIAVPPVLLLNTIWDAYDRHRVVRLVKGEIVLRRGRGT